MDPEQALKITCTTSDCKNPAEPTHCFKPKAGQPGPAGTCRECGADIIDWARVHERNIADVANTFTTLENETFRRHMMHVPVPERVQKLAIRVTRSTLKARLDRAIRKALVAPHSENSWDGIQTPRETSESARIYHFAQHATATCCRTCLEYWHNIPAEDRLTEEQVQYCVGLAWEYIRRRLGQPEGSAT